MHTYGSWEVFFYAAPTAQNSPDLHFRFKKFSIEPSLQESLDIVHIRYRINGKNKSFMSGVKFICHVVKRYSIEHKSTNS